MKKIFSNLWFMTVSIVLAAILLIVCIWLCARPISYNLIYTFKLDDTISTIIFKDKSTAVFEEKEDGEVINNGESKYYEKNGRIAVYHSDITIPYEEFAIFCEEMPAIEWEEISYKITPFCFIYDDMDLKCSEAVTLVIILGVVELVLIANATMCTILYIKNRKKS